MQVDRFVWFRCSFYLVFKKEYLMNMGCTHKGVLACYRPSPKSWFRFTQIVQHSALLFVNEFETHSNYLGAYRMKINTRHMRIKISVEGIVWGTVRELTKGNKTSIRGGFQATSSSVTRIWWISTSSLSKVGVVHLCVMYSFFVLEMDDR